MGARFLRPAFGRLAPAAPFLRRSPPCPRYSPLWPAVAGFGLLRGAGAAGALGLGLGAPRPAGDAALRRLGAGPRLAGEACTPARRRSTRFSASARRSRIAGVQRLGPFGASPPKSPRQAMVGSTRCARLCAASATRMRTPAAHSAASTTTSATAAAIAALSHQRIYPSAEGAPRGLVPGLGLPSSCGAVLFRRIARRGVSTRFFEKARRRGSSKEPRAASLIARPARPRS